VEKTKMRSFKILATSLAALSALVGCGGGNSGMGFTSMVSFGDSLSDVGTYKVGTVAALGGGKYTVNSSTAKNWTELIAAQIKLDAPCPAQTGLNGSAAAGFSVPVVNNTACRNYAQGGARVTNPVGPGNAALGGANAILGQLTVPVVTQISNHLKVVGGAFNGSELVTVMAGGNDLFINFATFGSTVAAGGDASAAASAAVAAMGTAGAELASAVKTQIVGKGAKYVVVINVPDMSKTPFGTSVEASAPGVVSAMVNAFNAQLAAGLVGSGVRTVDAYNVFRDQVANPGAYGLSNISTPACNLNTPSPNALGNSLVCNTSNVIGGDVSRYMFADTVHLTPYGYQLLANQVAKEMTAANWL
jgi:outer membrane lipase/esterase